MLKLCRQSKILGQNHFAELKPCRQSKILGQNHFAELKPACFDFSSSNFYLQRFTHIEHHWSCCLTWEFFFAFFFGKKTPLLPLCTHSIALLLQLARVVCACWLAGWLAGCFRRCASPLRNERFRGEALARDFAWHAIIGKRTTHSFFGDLAM